MGMAKPRKCPDCTDGIIKNHKAKLCWKCYLRTRPMPKSVFKKGQIAGEKHPQWKGGTWIYSRRKVLERDDFTCRVCGLRDEIIMDVDHIKPLLIKPRLRLRDKERNDDIRKNGLTNLQTLCPNCHKRKSIREAKMRSRK